MNLRCLFGHKWNACACERCGRTRVVPNAEHDWDGCRCKRCGQTRDEGHDWNGCLCRRCGQHHDWRGGCTCERCVEVRNEGHAWNNADDRCLRCEAQKTVESITCPDCNGVGADPDTMSHLSGQGGANICGACNATGNVTVTRIIMKTEK